MVYREARPGSTRPTPARVESQGNVRVLPRERLVDQRHRLGEVAQPAVVRGALGIEDGALQPVQRGQRGLVLAVHAQDAGVLQPRPAAGRRNRGWPSARRTPCRRRRDCRRRGSSRREELRLLRHVGAVAREGGGLERRDGRGAVVPVDHGLATNQLGVVRPVAVGVPRPRPSRPGPRPAPSSPCASKVRPSRLGLPARSAKRWRCTSRCSRRTPRAGASSSGRTRLTGPSCGAASPLFRSYSSRYSTTASAMAVAMRCCWPLLREELRVRRIGAVAHLHQHGRPPAGVEHREPVPCFTPRFAAGVHLAELRLHQLRAREPTRAGTR